MSERRLMIMQPNGAPLYADATRARMRGEKNPDLGLPATLDLSSIPNADTRALLSARVEERCDKGYWHPVGGDIDLPPWTDDDWKTT